MASGVLELSFRHRENLDGSWDSICLRCYATAAHSYGERLLAEPEQGHCCDESRWFFKQPLPPRRHDGRPAYLREAEPVARRGCSAGAGFRERKQFSRIESCKLDSCQL